jgi:hypothetical protein
MTPAAKHLRRTNIVACCPEAQSQLAAIFGDVKRAHKALFNEEHAVVMVPLSEQQVTHCEVATSA